MQRTNDIFFKEGNSSMVEHSCSESDVKIAIIVLSAISLLGLVLIILNFNAITESIALFLAKIISAGTEIIIFILIMAIIVSLIKRKIRRLFWR